MKKEAAIKIITDCAKIYDTNLANKNILFLFKSSGNKIEYFEAVFLPQHFLHLTGVQPAPKKTSTINFYKKCLTGKLSPHDFSFAPNGTTDMKLQVLQSLMKIDKTAKMVGEFNFSKSMLHTEKLAGSIVACLGFAKNNKTRYYFPNTALKEDIRDLTVKPQQRIIAILKKGVKDTHY
ncbi:MAG: PBECR4 domain-containing protein, partial [Oscillospiraceae bacterium]